MVHSQQPVGTAVTRTLTPSWSGIHYYDQHPTREDLMGESVIQAQIMRYLTAVLEWLYQRDGWFIATNLNIYRQPRYHAYPLVPDVAVFKGVRIDHPGQRTFRSWRMYEPGRPPPQVVFEIASDTTWKDDLRRKPIQYALLGVQEYFAYDPNQPPYFARQPGRLRGWRRSGRWLYALTPDTQGRLWSVELDSYLVVEGDILRLYDQEGQRRLTQAEAEQAAKEAERAAKEAAWSQLEVERAAKEAERAAKEAAWSQLEVERAAKEAAWARLRVLGIDPEAE